MTRTIPELAPPFPDFHTTPDPLILVVLPPSDLLLPYTQMDTQGRAGL
ncbi:hypothetical protein AVEN_52049-1, partial [Araneus ventricosus]